MFKQRSRKRGGEIKASLLSFDDVDVTSSKKKKKKLRRPASDLVSASVDAVHSRYDTASLAALAASQRSLPAELSVVANGDEPAAQSDEPAAQNNEPAAQNDEPEAQSDDEPAPDFIPLGATTRAEAEHRDRWLRAGADAGDVDAPSVGGALARGAARVGVLADDDDDELAAWESELVNRGARAWAPPAQPTSRPPPTASPHHHTHTRESFAAALVRAVADADAEADKAEREVQARRTQLHEHEAALARYDTDGTTTDAALSALGEATRMLDAAIHAYTASTTTTEGPHPQAAALREAMASAIALVETADVGPAVNMGVYDEGAAEKSVLFAH